MVPSASQGENKIASWILMMAVERSFCNTGALNRCFGFVFRGGAVSSGNLEEAFCMCCKEGNADLW